MPDGSIPIDDYTHWATIFNVYEVYAVKVDL